MKMHSTSMRSLVAVALLLVNSHALAVEQSRRTESSATANAHALSDIPSVQAHSTSSSDAFDTNEERAQSHLEEARKLFKTAKFESAIVELNQSYALFPRPICLFNIGQAYRRLGKRSEAIASFERFVAADPKSNFASEAQNTVNELRILLRQDEQMQRDKKPWRRGWFWGVLSGSLLGAAALTTGLVLGLQPRSESVDPRAPVRVQF